MKLDGVTLSITSATVMSSWKPQPCRVCHYCCYGAIMTLTGAVSERSLGSQACLDRDGC